MKKQKFYVVWEGKEKGIYTNWNDCKKQIDGYPQAKYKAFNTLFEAENASKNNWKEYMGIAKKSPKISQAKSIKSSILDSISVDGAWNTKTGKIEYQGVITKTKKKLFHQGPFEDGTNNIAEFLALVHALAYCKKKELQLPIYSDSKTAISWVKNKKAKTKHPKNALNSHIFNMIERAENWLKNNTFSNKILKWETQNWGENPADFGRK